MPVKVSGQPVLLLVEGKEDKEFFAALCTNLNIHDIQIETIEGVDNLIDELRLVRKDGTFKDKVRSLGIVRDADTNPDSALKMVVDSLKSAGFSDIPQVPLISSGSKPKITFMLLPGDNQVGTLEDLLSKAFEKDELMKCVDKHFECLQDQGMVFRENVLPKSRFRVFFASKAIDNTVDDGSHGPAWHLTIAYKRSWWPWNHPAFEFIKDFLQQLSV